jgi:N-acetylglucosamine-1-phosphodiester alpha-N-acetylglucosaminidase
MRVSATLLAGGLLLMPDLILGAGISGTTGFTLVPVFNAQRLTGSDLLPTVQVINVPLLDVDGVTRAAKGHFVTAVDSTMFSIYPPIQGCGYGLTTTSAEARYRGCSVAMNMGFFDISNTTHPHCLGGVVSDNVLIEHDATGAVHFGLTSDGNWFIGYVNNTFLGQHTLASLADRCDSTGVCINDTDSTWFFRSLASGQVQLVNKGENYVDASSGVNTFTTEASGRTAIGVLPGGRLGLVQIDGRTGQDGIDLFTLADVMVKLGFKYAINLDGGGSSTTAINGVLASLPSDGCPGDEMGFLGCERAVSTIVCLQSSPQQFVVGTI